MALPVIVYLSMRLVEDFEAFPLELIVWGVLVAAADLMPVSIWKEVQLSMSLPVLLAASMIFQPWQAGILALAASWDRREFSRQVTLGKALHNRAQVAVSVLAASFTFHTLNGDVAKWPEVLLVALPTLFVDLLVNSAMVLLPVRLLTDKPLASLLREMFHGSAPAFFTAYFAFGLVAVLLATVYLAEGSWGLVAFMVPVVLSRQAFKHWRRLAEVATALAERERALVLLAQRVADERRDERLVVAAELHDEVLPPIYKVHLMGQVLRQDLASGRLLDLDEDLPELLAATELASRVTRSLIRGLRVSPLGPGGLNETLGLLVESLRSQTAARVRLWMEDVGGSPLSQLIAYQIAREALVNAVRHSNATEIILSLARAPGQIEVSVTDNGDGFEALPPRGSNHFGHELMAERARSVGGELIIESTPGQGTRVRARIPVDAPTMN